MAEQFGRRPEPWLVEEDVLEVEIGIDFDGSASGVAAPSTGVRNDLAIPDGIVATPSSPIGMARDKALSVTVTDPPSTEDTGDLPVQKSRGWLYAVVAAAAVAVIAVIAIASSSGSGDADAKAAATSPRPQEPIATQPTQPTQPEVTPPRR